MLEISRPDNFVAKFEKISYIVLRTFNGFYYFSLL